MINNKNCFNCAYSHIFGDKLKCSLDSKSDDGSDYTEVDEYDYNKPCWKEVRTRD